MKFHRKLMRYHSSLFMRSRQKVMTSATLIYSPHLNEIPPQKRGLTGLSYTTPLLQFNWYCEREGDNDEALTWGRDLINLFFPKDFYRRSLFFFLTYRARWRDSRLLSRTRQLSKRKIKDGLSTG